MGKGLKRASKQKDIPDNTVPSLPLQSPSPAKKPKNSSEDEDDLHFAGEPVPVDEAREKWPHRYQSKGKVKGGACASSKSLEGRELGENEVLQARCHYKQAIVDGMVLNLYDDAYVKAEEGKPDFIAKIVEMFETLDRELYFCAQWFFRAEDTIIEDQAHLIDKRRMFYSDMKDDNPLSSIVSKVKIVQLAPNADSFVKEKAISSCDLYYDMAYSLPITYTTLATENLKMDSDESSVISSDASSNSAIEGKNGAAVKSREVDGCKESEMTLLDLYSGCGAMSTGLCFGANMSGVKLVTKWAVDIDPHACKSLKLNHSETEVRNEAAEDFLSLLKEWENLCKEFHLLGSHRFEDISSRPGREDSEESEDAHDSSVVSSEEFEVGKLLAIHFGDPNNKRKCGLYFKVRWKGYGPSEDTWEPINGLSNCQESIEEFVSRGYKSRILPLPGDVDFICGGPPCQGISGYNRYRNSDDPMKDPKNHQLVVYMDIIEFLKPKYVLMENVVDIVKFSDGKLVSYAIGRLVSMNYQTRLGIMAAGSYGVPQCRLRVFLWGTNMMKNLPQFPLPTHEVIGRGVVTNGFKECIVGCDREKSCKLEKSVLLGDAISDLPDVTNSEVRDEMEYGVVPCTSFQKYIRMNKQGHNASNKKILYDHRPLKVNDDDYARICQIPKKKGANFRDLPGVRVGPNNKVEWDPLVKRVMLPTGKPLVPDYAMTFVKGTSTKPFGRLGMDDIVTTVVTRAKPHNQAVLHPNQDRVLTIRENARLQGFPDHYKLCGPVKERYMQVGNAVAFSVSIALGHTLAKAVQGISTDQALTLPVKFPDCLGQLKSRKQIWDESS